MSYWSLIESRNTRAAHPAAVVELITYPSSEDYEREISTSLETGGVIGNHG